jgi:Calcineurin-like phosphoesterase
MRTALHRLLAGAATVAVVAAALVSGTTQVAAAATSTVIASDDSYVRQDQPTTNYGSATSVQADASPVTNGYLKFTVSGVTGSISRATLRIFSRSTGTTSVKVAAVANTSWSEGAITYSNAPAIGAQIGATGALTAGTWATVDVSAKVLGNGSYSFALTTGTTSARLFDSRQAANPPQLVLETSSDPVVVIGGDVACATDDPNYNGGAGTAGFCHQRATAALIGQVNPAAVLALGDLQYNSGSLAAYSASYGPSWGQYRSRTKPTVGNHDYGQSGAAGYFGYFGNLATPLQPGCTRSCDGYYSFDLGAWHVVNINAECTRLNGGAGCAAGSPQDKWLEADLAAHPNTCTLVFGHRPRWSSNSFASPDIAPLIDDMYAAGVDLYVAGHSHAYERFASQNPTGQADAKGIRQFVVGTGGANYSGFGTVAANSQIRKSKAFGIAKLTLHPGSYDWSFVADPSTPYSDSGTGTCH